jgi:predicted nucleic acid-binding protein
LLKQAVVDASVAVKWVVPEDHSEEALSLLTDGVMLYVPSHWLAEVSTTFWAKCAFKGVLTREQAAARVKWIASLDFAETSVSSLIMPATDMAFDLHLTVYDTLYLALAVQVAAPLVTADRKLFDKAKADRRYANSVVWVADLA